jgi:hypothetical protein
MQVRFLNLSDFVSSGSLSTIDYTCEILTTSVKP